MAPEARGEPRDYALRLGPPAHDSDVHHEADLWIEREPPGGRLVEGSVQQRGHVIGACSRDVDEQLVVQAEHDRRARTEELCADRGRPGLEQFGRRTLDDRVAHVASLRGDRTAVRAEAFGRGVGSRRRDPARLDQATAVRPDRPGRAPSLLGRLERSDRVRVGPLHRSERVAGGTRGLPVHRRQHRDLRGRSIAAEALGHRRVQVVVRGRDRERPVAGHRSQYPRLDLTKVGPHERGGRGSRPRLGAARPAGCAGRTERSSGRLRRRCRSIGRADVRRRSPVGPASA